MQIKVQKEQIPWAMAAGRALIGPVLLLGERCGWSGLGLAALVVTALLSDIFDGVLARRWKCDTAGVRLFDSTADAVFYVCAGVALWIGPSPVLRTNAGLLVALLALEATRYVVEFAKFGKPASYHSYLAKAWGLVMAAAMIWAFAANGSPGASVLLGVSLALGIVSNLEGLAMSLILPVWRKDVKGLAVAWAMAKEVQGSRFEGGAGGQFLPARAAWRLAACWRWRSARRRCPRSRLSRGRRPMRAVPLGLRWTRRERWTQLCQPS